MDASTIAAFASAAVALIALLGLVGPVYLRLGKLEGEVKAGRERSDAQHRELRDWAEVQFRESRERSNAQHAETLAEIRRLTDALVAHSHTDGGIISHIPPPSSPPRQE